MAMIGQQKYGDAKNRTYITSNQSIHTFNHMTSHFLGGKFKYTPDKQISHAHKGGSKQSSN